MTNREIMLYPMMGIAVALSLESCNSAVVEKPNVIYILVDDLGYGNLSCYGQAKYETPNIDAMASRGSSDQKLGRFMAVSKAMSGAPIYLSGVAVASVESSKKELKITMRENGALLVYSEKAIKRVSKGKVEALEGNLYRITDTDKELTLYR